MTVNTPVYNPVPFARDGLKNIIPVDEASNRASMIKGFPAETMRPLASGGIPPTGQDVNGILYQLSSHQVFLNAGGLYKFNAAYANAIGGYSLGAVLQLDDGLSSVICILQGNMGNPNSSMAGWAPYAGHLLEQRILALENTPAYEDILVGDIFITMNAFTTAAEIAAHKGYGSWQRVAEGQFIIGAGTHVDSRGESRNFVVGENGGEYQHVQTEAEVAPHVHRIAASPAVYDGVNSDLKGGYIESSKEINSMLQIVAKSDSLNDFDDNYSIKPASWASTGEGQPMNNIPPYIAMSIWKRLS